jgi:hypothetical protein
VGAGARLNAYDTLLYEHPLQHSADVLGILGGYYIVGDNQNLVAAIEQSRRDGFDDGGFARTYGPTDSYSATIFHCLIHK